MKYTFLTVAFQGEANLLMLQARSAALYLPRDLAAEIIVVDNTPPGERGLDTDAIRNSYGELASLVRIIAASEIADIPETVAGWYSQQVMKLMIADRIDTERYVVLDAKNQFVYPLTQGFLESEGKIRTSLHGYENHPLRLHIERVLTYFGLDPSAHIQSFTPASTPYTLPTKTVRELVKYMVDRDKIGFPQAFVNIDTTEFLLFAAYIRATDERVEDHFDFSQGHCQVIWEHNAEAGPASVAKLISYTEKKNLPLFGVHREAFLKLDAESRELIAEYWLQRGLFDTVGAGLEFLGHRDA